MSKDNSFYRNRVVYKPWGYEHVVYSDSNRLAITLVRINYGHKVGLLRSNYDECRVAIIFCGIES